MPGMPKPRSKNKVLHHRSAVSYIRHPVRQVRKKSRRAISGQPQPILRHRGRSRIARNGKSNLRSQQCLTCAYAAVNDSEQCTGSFIQTSTHQPCNGTCAMPQMRGFTSPADNQMGIQNTRRSGTASDAVQTPCPVCRKRPRENLYRGYKPANKVELNTLCTDCAEYILGRHIGPPYKTEEEALSYLILEQLL